MLNFFQYDGNMLESQESYLEVQSHIKGLGLDETGHAVEGSDGMIGQQNVRESAGVAVKLLKQKTDLRRFVLISGPFGSGKSAISKGIMHEMECDCNVVLLKDELENPKRCQLQILTQALRKAIQIRIEEDNFIIFGEVVEINYDKPAPGLNSSVGSIVMQTKDMAAIYGLDVTMIERLKNKKIEKGDVLTINFACGEIICVGNTDPTKNKKFMECPYGELAVFQPLFHRVNLNEIDVYNTFYKQTIESAEQLTNLVIKDDIRELVNLKVQQWVTEGKAEILWGAVLIENVKYLNTQCINYLQTAKTNWMPFVILNAIQDIEEFGFSKKFLKSVIKITTSNHSDQEIEKILSLRKIKNKIAIAEKNYQELKQIAKLSLSFAVRILHVINSICMKILLYPELQILFVKNNSIFVKKNFYSALLLNNIPLIWEVETTFIKHKIFLTFEFIQGE